MAHADPDRDQLEVLASDFLARLRRGDSPEIEDYAEAHPELAQDIRELFPTVREAEQIKLRHTQRLRVAPGGEGSADSTAALSLAPRERPVGAQGGSVEPVSPYPGMALGKYTLQERAGRGSLGSVWRAQHPEFGIPVAIKVLHANAIDGDPEDDQRFLREARSAALLNHPHIIRVFDAGVDQGLRYLVMEYVEGGTVASLQAQLGGKLPVEQTIRIAVAMAQAIEGAVGAGIVHRDIKPENILLDGNGWPKLADLGLAKQIVDAGESSVTRPGQSLGTPLYIAPEQAVGNAVVDVRTDIYSLGATLYHVLTGAPPFDGATPYDIVDGHLHKPLVDPRERNPDVSRQLSKIICRMLAKRPEDRYQSPTELKAELTRLADNAGGATERGGMPRSWRPWTRRITALALLALVGAILIPYLYQRFTRDPVGEGGGPAAAMGTGTLRLDDWQAVGGIPGTPGGHPRPARAPEFSMRSGVLHFAGGGRRGVQSLLYGTAHIEGPFRLRMEAMNVDRIGIAGAPGMDEQNQITLLDPAAGAGTKGAWHIITLERDRGTLTCLVDGKRAHAVTGDPLAAGRFWLSFPGDGPGAVRVFELRSEAPPGGRLPEPMRRRPGPPR